MCFLLVLVMFSVRESLTLHLTLSREPLSNYRFVGPISRFFNSHKRQQAAPEPMMPYMDFDMSGFMQPSFSDFLQMTSLDTAVDNSPTVVTAKPFSLSDFGGHKSVSTNSRWSSGQHSYSEGSTDFRENHQPNSFHMTTSVPMYQEEAPEAPNYQAEPPSPHSQHHYQFAQHDEGRKEPTKIVVYQPPPKARWPQKSPSVWQEETVRQRTKIPQHSHGGWYGSVSDASLEVPHQKEWRSRARRRKSLKKWKAPLHVKDHHYHRNEDFKIVYVESGRHKHSSGTTDVPEEQQEQQEQQEQEGIVYGKPLKENGAFPKKIWKGSWD